MKDVNRETIYSWIDSIFKGKLRKTQRVNLSLLVWGILLSRCLVVSAISRKLPICVKSPKYKYRRINRFLTNIRVSLESCIEALIYEVSREYKHKRYLPVIIDYTSWAKSKDLSEVEPIKHQDGITKSRDA